MKFNRSFIFAYLTVALVMASLFAAPSLRAQNTQWAGAASLNNWSVDTNWTPTGAPGNGANVIFSAELPTNNLTSFLDYGLQLNYLEFDNGSAGNHVLYLAGGDLSLAGIGLDIFQESGSQYNTTLYVACGTTQNSLSLLNDAAIVGSGQQQSIIQNNGFNNFYGSGYALGGEIIFQNYSAIKNASIENEGAYAMNMFGAPITGADAGLVAFYDNSVNEARIDNAGGQGPGSAGAQTIFYNSSKSIGGTLTASKSTAGGSDGQIIFHDSSSAGNSVIYINTTIGSLNGGLFFDDTSTGGNSVITNNGTVDISADTTPDGVTVGTIAGAGRFYLGSQTLIISGYSGVALSETVSGAIADGGQASGRGGSLTMASSGDTLTLTGNNTYTGATTVNAGTLILAGMSSSSSFAVAANGTLDLASGYFSISGTIVNNGTLVLGNEVALSSAGTFTNNGTLDLSNDPGFILPENFVNNGTIIPAPTSISTPAPPGMPKLLLGAPDFGLRN